VISLTESMILDETLAERSEALRAFSRFYTAVIGVLQEGLLETPYSLTEARVIFELGRRGEMDVADLRTTLDLDAGYLSRIRARLEEGGLVTRARSGDDRRRHVIGLTSSGRAAYDVLNRRSAAQAQALVRRLGEDDQRALIEALSTTQRLLGEGRAPEATLRALRPGDLGWVVERHGALYASEHDWDASFEALVARIVADFAAGADPARERAWIAEAGGARAGSVFCTRRDETTAQLRLLLVEPAFRGQGLGRRLVDECLAFARSGGYARIVLWTNDVLVDARRIYERAGFALDEEGRHTSFGHDLVEQTWSRRL
jgi:DNA-binding MarR family transcriptional regulator/predicted N-acetyltransferase YhbS